MLLLVVWLLICTVLAVDAFAMDVSIVTGTKVGGDVSHDFGKTTLTVSPERAVSITNKFEQVLTIKNSAGVDLYYFIDPYSTNIKTASISEISYVNAQIPNYVEVCKEELNNTKTISVCHTEQSGTKTLREPTYALLQNSVTSWGEAKHTFNTQGILINNGETKQFLIEYETLTKTGKWNARVSADSSPSNHECVLDNRKDCSGGMWEIDPTWTAGTTGLLEYWSFDNDTVVGYYGNGTDHSTTSGAGILGLGRNCTGANWFDFTEFGISGNFTLNFWVYYKRNNTQEVIQSGQNIVPRWDLYHIAIDGKIAEYQSPVASSIPFANATSFPPYMWIMITVIRNSTTNTFYLYENGSSRGTGSPNEASNYMFHQFCRAYADNEYFQGGLDEIGVWSRILTNAEISALWNSGSGYNPFASVVTSNYTVTIVNQTYNSTVYETQNYQYLINVSWGANVSNITGMTLNAFNYSYTPTVLSNGTLTNQTWRQYGVSDVRPPLVVTNGTIYPFNWTFTTRLDNGTNYTNVTSNINQTVLWAYYPTNIFMESQSIETHNTTWNNSYSMKEGNMTGVGFAYTTQYNAYTNVNVTSTNLSQNSTVTQNVTFYYGVPMLNSTDNTKMMSMRPYLNITFNGTTIGGRNTSLTANQGVYKILLTNCSNASITDATTNQFFVRDIITDLLLNANTILTYQTWLTENYNIAGLERNYTFTFTSNSSPRVCIYPNGTTYTFQPFTYSANRTYNTTMTGYLASSGTETVTLSNTTSNTTIYLTNSSAVQEVVITVTDQNDNKLKNYSVNAYLYSGGSYNLLDTEVTNLQGQVRFNLYIYDRQYQFRVYYPNGTLAVSAPTSGGATIISTSFTIKVYLVPQVTIGNVVEMMSLSNSLTFNNATGLVNLSFNDSNNLTSNNCLQIMNMTSGNRSGSVLALNCTTNQNGTLTYNLGVVNGTFVAQYIATRREDGLNYLVNYLVINRNTYFNFQREGIFWSFLLIGTIAAIGLFINPVLGIIFMEFGIVASWWIGILPIGWMAMASIVAAGFFVAFFLGKEQ